MGVASSIVIGLAAVAAGAGVAASTAHQGRKAAKTATRLADLRETKAKKAAAMAKLESSASAKAKAAAFQSAMTPKVLSAGKTLGSSTATEGKQATLGA